MTSTPSPRIALITGATSGIGRDTAIAFAHAGINLILCGRRRDRLDQLKAELSGQVKVTNLCFDISSYEETTRALAAIPAEFKKIDIIINNAGNAHGRDPFQTSDLRDIERMIDINLKGVIYLTRTLVGGMIERQAGHIINVGSIAGRDVYPQGSVYCASKAALETLTNGLRMDLNPHGIKVSAVHPGLVETEFSLVRFKGDAEKAQKVYADTKPLSGRDVADLILYMVNAPAHVNLADVLILPLVQASSTMVRRF